MESNYICIAGNIGTGKSTFAGRLEKYLHDLDNMSLRKWKVFYEPVEDNPYLEDFYKDMDRWAFNLQTYFLNRRYEDLLYFRRHPEDRFIQDRSIYEDACIFVPNLHDMGIMSDRDFDNYRRIFSNLNSGIIPPRICIYLRSSVSRLKGNIARRGRECEASISEEYLSNLNRRYEEWFRNYSDGPKMLLDMDNTDTEDEHTIRDILKFIL